MIRHLCKLVWNRKRANALTAFQIFISFLIVFITASIAVDNADKLPAAPRIFLRKQMGRGLLA